ncbi:hypothetical protein HY024_01495 [Candidatus Curtissbacteria bacterium]|nr:hypothetical protein [Candidatus Curtissbacteria bacterium]
MQDRAVATISANPTTISSDHPCLQISERRANNYEVLFDFGAYKELQNLKPFLEPEEYQRKREQLDARTKNNLLTTLMERFNVQVSQVRYEMVNGKLKSPDHDDPMEDVIVRGQQYRLRNGNPIDRPREVAEVINFQKRQEALKRGAKTNVYISPRGADGTDYIHHFFGTDEVQADGSILTSIYTLKIPHHELLEAIQKLNRNYAKPQPGEPFDAFVIRNSIADVPIEKVLSVLHQDESSMPLSEFGVKVEIPTRELRDFYIKRAAEGATEQELSAIRKSMLKLADLSTGKDTFTLDNANALADIQTLTRAHGVQAIIALLATQQLRNVPTNCGIQESTTSAWSVGEFGFYRDGSGTLQIICKTCGFSYMRTSAILEQGCRLCSGKDGIAC